MQQLQESAPVFTLLCAFSICSTVNIFFRRIFYYSALIAKAQTIILFKLILNFEYPLNSLLLFIGMKINYL